MVDRSDSVLKRSRLITLPETVTIVTSAYNEAQSVRRLVTGLKNFCGSNSDVVTGAVIVDNGSTDSTFESLRAELSERVSHSSVPIEVVRNPVGKGWGDGIRFGHRFVASTHVLTLPSDLQFPWESVSAVIDAFRTNQPRRNLAILSFRSDRRDGHFNAIRGSVFKKVVRRAFNFASVKDPVSQLRLYPKGLVKDLGFPADAMYDVYFAKTIENLDRVNLLQIPVTFTKRVAGISSTGGYFSASIQLWRRLLDESKKQRRGSL